MLNVHLYFLKLFGCHIAEVRIPIDLTEFAAAILAGRAHPNVYLRFGLGPLLKGNRMVGMSDIHARIRNSDGKCAFGSWIYDVDGVAVNVSFSLDRPAREVLADSWHPNMGTSRLVIADLR